MDRIEKKAESMIVEELEETSYIYRSYRSDKIINLA